MSAWRQLAGQRVGSRVLMVVSPKDHFGRNGDPAALITGSDTLVFVIDIVAHRSQAAERRKEFSYGLPYMQPLQAYAKPGGIPERLKPFITPKGINPRRDRRQIS
jgi:hypothetical protein